MKDSHIWAEIDLGAVGKNIEALRRKTSGKSVLMAVVKADGYGHGAVKVAETALKCGAGWLGVARADEGLLLRESGIDAPVLVFGFTGVEYAEKIIKSNLSVTVSSLDNARDLSCEAEKSGQTIKVHIKIDTGMGRMGFIPGSPAENTDACESFRRTIDEIRKITELPGLKTEGIYTHFATADSTDKTYASKQFEIFNRVLERLDEENIKVGMRHAANSAAIIQMPETHLDMVRAGISIYGLYPSDDVSREEISLTPAMTLKTRVVQQKKVCPGFRVSYGCTWEAESHTTISTVAAGYADGVSRMLSSKGEMLIGGRRYKIAGRVCMDLIMLDTGSTENIRCGDEVVIFGRQGCEELHVDEVADILGTINYEVVSTITSRVPRLYV